MGDFAEIGIAQASLGGGVFCLVCEPCVSVPASEPAGKRTASRANAQTVRNSCSRKRERVGCHCRGLPCIMVMSLLCRPRAGAARLETHPRSDGTGGSLPLCKAI